MVLLGWFEKNVTGVVKLCEDCLYADEEDNKLEGRGSGLDLLYRGRGDRETKLDPRDCRPKLTRRHLGGKASMARTSKAWHLPSRGEAIATVPDRVADQSQLPVGRACE